MVGASLAPAERPAAERTFLEDSRLARFGSRWSVARVAGLRICRAEAVHDRTRLLRPVFQRAPQVAAPPHPPRQLKEVLLGIGVEPPGGHAPVLAEIIGRHPNPAMWVAEHILHYSRGDLSARLLGKLLEEEIK